MLHRSLFLAVFISLGASRLFAEVLPAETGEVISVKNVVERNGAQVKWLQAKRGDHLRWKDRIRTGEMSRAEIKLPSGGLLSLTEFTDFFLKPPITKNEKSASKINFLRGAAYFISRSESEADIETPSASLNIRGTEFVIEVNEQGVTTISLVEGAVILSNALGSVSLESGEQGVSEKGKAPVKTAMLDVSDRIQWFLYYPGLADPTQFQGLSTGLYSDAYAAYALGDILGALRLLPPAANSPEEHLFCAAVKLSSGRLDRVGESLRHAGSSELSEAIELMIQTVKFPSESASPNFSPVSADGQLALSYALQARGDLFAAKYAATRAVELSPEFGFAWARLAELEFGFGRTKEAEVALARALQYTPKNAQALSLSGYLHLAKGRVLAALADFDKALEVDPSLGNAWLGRGLAYMQQGEGALALDAMMVAVAVEPNRSFLRSYLAKAFSALDKDQYVDTELLIARELDAGDPTPLLYQALFDQRNYRFNSGIENLEESIRLNDNRAVYRSAFLLDQDRSIREANLASIYENAGLTQPSLEAARRSVVSDYLNPSAHLFLSNSFNNLRDPQRASLRYETPWFSELLLANLLSPAGTSLYSQNISQQEYVNLFPAKNYSVSTKTRYLSSGEWNATGTLKAHSARTSVAFDYEVFNSNGTRPNHDTERITGYLQAKHAFTNQDSLYLNLKFQEFEGGDLRQLYDSSTYDPDYRVEQEQAPLVIAGYQHEWSPQSRTLAIGGLLTDEIRVSDMNATSFAMIFDASDPMLTAPLAFPSDLLSRRETEVYFSEVQHLWSDELQTLIVGARFDVGQFTTQNSFYNQAIFGLLPSDPYIVEASPDYQRWVLYSYYTREVQHGLWLTGGLAFDSQSVPVNTVIQPVSSEERSVSEVLPKLGIVWAPDDVLTVRMGYARSLGGATFDESVRLEPTQVAGFTQSFRTLANESIVGGLASPLFDTIGLSVSYEFPSRTYVGFEAFWRRAEAERGAGVLGIDNGSFMFDSAFQIDEQIEYSEWGGLVYVNQLIGDQFAIGVRYEFTEAKLDRSFPALSNSGITGFASDSRSQLHYGEAYALWNHPAGWFGRLDARYLAQTNSGASPGSGDSWAQFDCTLGKRFFRNRAALEVGVLNLTDEDYNYNPLITLNELPRERLFYIELRIDL